MRKSFPMLTALLALLLLGGCFEAREEIWLGREGSGRIRVEVAVRRPALALAGGEKAIREKVEAAIRGRGDLRLREFEIISNNKKDRLVVDLETTSLDALRDLDAIDLPRQAQALAGEIEVSTADGLLRLRRTIRPGDALRLGPFAPSPERVGAGRLVHVLHLPEAATASNATEVRDGGRTLIWEHALADHLESPLVLEVETPRPLPLWVRPLAWMAAFGGIFVLLMWLRRRYRSRFSAISRASSIFSRASRRSSG